MSLTRDNFEQLMNVHFKTKILESEAPPILGFFDNDGGVPPGDEEYIRITYRHGDRVIRHSRNRNAFFGVIFFDIFIPHGNGAARLTELSDLIDDEFSQLEGEEFELEGAGVTNLGQVDGLYQYQVSVNFNYRRAVQNREVTLSCT